MKKNFFAFLFVMFALMIFDSYSAHAIFDSQEKQRRIELEAEVENVKAQLQKVQAELNDMTLDRDNILKQAQNIQKEKDELLSKIEELKGAGSGAEVELESFKKEHAILNAELEKLKTARVQDQKKFEEEKVALQKNVEDEKARIHSLMNTMGEYTPERVQEIVEDRNRLEDENKRMAQKVFEYEEKMKELRRQMTPLELDREELHRVQTENRELNKRIAYVQKLEKRQEQLIKENKEYREQLEVLKAKFKESVPGLAKSNRISQKMMRENADMHYNLGTVFLNNKKYKEAIREYESVLELRPSDPETHYNLGILYDDYLKDREKALYHYQKYLAVNPKAPDAKKVESYILSLELEQKVR